MLQYNNYEIQQFLHVYLKITLPVGPDTYWSLVLSTS